MYEGPEAMDGLPENTTSREHSDTEKENMIGLLSIYSMLVESSSTGGSCYFPSKINDHL